MEKINYEKIVNDLYQEILLRAPDKAGSYHFVSQLKNKEITINELRSHLSSSEEAKYILSLDEMRTVEELDEETKKIIDDLYREILQRSAPQEEFEYWGSLLENERISKSDLRKSILKSQEAIAIKNFSHYSDKYWNDLVPVVKYKNKLSTGNENIHWIDDILTRFENFIPFKKVLIVGCGNGWLERKLFDMGLGLEFDAFDVSEKYIEDAEKMKNDRNINYFQDDINNLKKVEKKKYDAVFNFAILHHALKIDDAMKKLSESLKRGGLIFNEEYVGPAQNQYSNKHLELMMEVSSDIPEQYRTSHTLRPPLAWFRVEPTEAIHSDMVIPTFKKYFKTVYEKNMNGGIAYQILWNNISNFEDSSDLESIKWLNYILEKDEQLTAEGKVPVLFWYCVGTTKQI